MGGMPIGLIEELVTERRADLVRGAAARGRAAEARRLRRLQRMQCRSSQARHRAPVRAAGRFLVAAGVRLAGPDALREVRIAGAGVLRGGRADLTA